MGENVFSYKSAFVCLVIYGEPYSMHKDMNCRYNKLKHTINKNKLKTITHLEHRKIHRDQNYSYNQA